MSTICFYFQVHQPFRLKSYDFTRIGEDHMYEDDALNRSVFDKVAENCYLPMNKLLMDLFEEHGDRFKVAMSISGVALDQIEHFNPAVLDSFKALIATGNVELLSETYYHSLAGLYDEGEFKYQVELHKAKLKELFDYTPKTIRNTELIMTDAIARWIGDMGYANALIEAPKPLWDEIDINAVHALEAAPSTKVICRDTILSDDIAFRFSDINWEEYPMMAPDFVKKIKAKKEDSVVGLYMDYETFGEHRNADTGIFEFMRWLPQSALEEKVLFQTPSEILETKEAQTKIAFKAPVSWASEEKDISSWCENGLQSDALDTIYELQEAVVEFGSKDYLNLWRKLQTSDHFYYMSTKYKNDPIHQSFNHYETPFDAFINYMNVLTDFKKTLN